MYYLIVLRFYESSDVFFRLRGKRIVFQRIIIIVGDLFQTNTEFCAIYGHIDYLFLVKSIQSTHFFRT